MLYLLLVLLGPLRLISIPATLFVDGNATATAANIRSHESPFRLGMVGDVPCALLLIFFALACYRLFERVDRNLAAMVVVFGGVMPALISLRQRGERCERAPGLVVQGAPFLSVFDASQRNAVAMLLLDIHARQNTAAQILRAFRCCGSPRSRTDPVSYRGSWPFGSPRTASPTSSKA